MCKPGVYRINVAPVVLTMREVKELNRESIRLGFSRNLKNLGRLPDDMRVRAPEVHRHVSRMDNPPLTNIRLVLLLPTYIGKKWRARNELKKSARSVVLVTLDITEDAWQGIRNREVAQNGSQTC